MKILSIASILLLANTAICYAQKNNGSNQKANPAMITGHFDINKENKQRGFTEHINVNYALSPVPFRNVLNLELSTPDPTFFSADIVDSKDNKELHWEPSAISHIYNDAIDISTLAPGKYKANIYSGHNPALLYSISFEKVQSN